MAEDLKKETAQGVFWSGIERFSSVGIQLLANIILARILTPNDFGLVAIISIFVQISQTFIDSGFTNALIQKKDRTQEDYSTVFIFNLVIAVFFYGILFFCAPLIAHFFNNDTLIPLTRVIGINLIIGALVAVHKTRLTVQLRFKIQSIITLLASLISTVIAIITAYRGYGVWSLVILSTTNISLQVILVYSFIHWKPSLSFSKHAFKQLFSFSSKLLGASMIHMLYRNIYPIVIGKKFTTVQLGYFNRADTFAMYPPTLIGNVFSRVAFPVFSRMQDDNGRLRNAYSKYIVFSSLIIFPIIVGMIVLAHPLIVLVLTSKWLPMVVMLQILCLDWMTDHLCMINLNVLYVKGRSDLAFRLEIIKKTLAMTIFLISLYWGIIGVCWGRVLYGVVAVFLNSFYTKKLIALSLWSQLKDISRPFVFSVMMGLVVLITSKLFMSNLTISVCVSVIIGIASYFFILYVFGRKYLMEGMDIINRLRGKN